MGDGKQCTATLDGGNQCGAYALTDKDFCFSHDPESKDAKQEATRRGGLVKQIKITHSLALVEVDTPKDVVTLLATTINEVRAGTLDPRIANTIGYLSGHLIRAFEVADMNTKLDEIRAVIQDRLPNRPNKWRR